MKSFRTLLVSFPAKMVLAGFILLLVGTFVAWRISTYLSPSSSQTGNGATVTWMTSDHSLVGAVKTPLLNSTTDPAAPSYEELNGATPLTVVGNIIQLPRFQGTISYQ